MKRTFFAVVVTLLLSATVQAQVNPCAGSGTNCTTASGAPLAVTVTPWWPDIVWPYICVGEDISVTVAPTLGLAGLKIITTTNEWCVITVTTNALPSGSVVSNWWTVTGTPGFGTGFTATFAPTNYGTGSLAFYLTYQEASLCGGGNVTVSVTNTFTAVSVASLAPTNCTNCVLLSSNATEQTWVVPVSTNVAVSNLEIAATSNPSVPATDLPECWSLDGVVTNITYVSITNPAVYTVVCAAGTSVITNIILVTDSGGDVEVGCVNGPAMLGYWSFDTNAAGSWLGNNGQQPLEDYGLQNPVSPWGNALQVDTNISANLSYRYTETNGAANINCINGAVSFWFKPDWNGGTGTTRVARFLEMGDTNSLDGWWFLGVDPSGSNLSFQSESNGVQITYFTQSVTNWSSNSWYQLVLNYSTSQTSLYINGALAQTGPGMTNYPTISERVAYGFSIGSEHDGTHQAQGTFDELATFSCPLSAQAIADSYLAGLAAGNGVLTGNPLAFQIYITRPLNNSQIP
jgi:hypothetical protein